MCLPVIILFCNENYASQLLLRARPAACLHRAVCGSRIISAGQGAVGSVCFYRCFAVEAWSQRQTLKSEQSSLFPGGKTRVCFSAEKNSRCFPSVPTKLACIGRWGLGHDEKGPKCERPPGWVGGVLAPSIRLASGLGCKCLLQRASITWEERV